MTQNTPSSQWKSLTNCLGRRVLSVSLILLVIPLFFHAFLLYRQAIYQTSIDNLTNLSLLARSESAYVKELVQKNTLDIKTIELLGSYDKAEDLKNLSAELAQVALSEELSTLFIAEKNTSGSWNIIAAAHPERVNMTDVGLGEFNTISVLGTNVYLFLDPITQKRELRIGYMISENRLIVSGIPLANVSSQLVKTPTIRHTPIAAFVTIENQVYFATQSDFSLDTCKIYHPEELVDITNLPKSVLKIDKETNFVGVKVPVASDAFYLVIALPKKQFLDFSSKDTFNHLIQITILFALVGGGGVVLLTMRIARPLKQLFTCLDEVGKGNLHASYHDDKLGFELNVLGQKFNQMLENLNQSIQEAKSEKMAKELLKQELSIGQSIQKAILTTSLHHVGPYNFSYAFAPSMEVSGDFYDVYQISQNKVLFAVADTSGKGISACLYSLGARSMLRALALTGVSLDVILTQMNQLFLEDAENYGTFITAFIGILDITTHEITYASCGHPPAYLISKNGLETLSTKGIALGIDADTKYKVQTLTLNPDQKLLLYTDGVIEACSGNGQLYGASRLEALLLSEKDYSCSSLVQDIKNDVEHYSSPSELFDDLTILCVERK